MPLLRHQRPQNKPWAPRAHTVFQIRVGLEDCCRFACRGLTEREGRCVACIINDLINSGRNTLLQRRKREGGTSKARMGPSWPHRVSTVRDEAVRNMDLAPHLRLQRLRRHGANGGEGGVQPRMELHGVRDGGLVFEALAK